MNKCLIVTIYIYFVMVCSLIAQTAVGNKDGKQTLMDLRDNYGTYIGLQPQSEGVIGTPFLFDEMVNASLHLKNGKQHEDVFLNIYPEKSEVFVQLPNKNVVSPELGTIEKIVLKESIKVYKPIQINNRMEVVEVLFEDEEEKFIVHKYKKFQKAVVGGAYNTTSNFDEYKEIVNYYRVTLNSLEEIKQNNNGLKTLSGNNWKLTKSFVKENNIDWNESSDALKIYMFSRDKQH